MEDDFRASRERMLSRTERIIGIGSWEWDIVRDTMTWSEGLFHIFRLDPAEGAPGWDEQSAWVHSEDVDRLGKAVEKALSEARPFELELRAVRRDGEIRDIIAWGFPELDPGGNVIALHGSVQDITERRRGEAELRESEQRYRTIFERNRNPIAIVDTDGRYLEANAAFLDFVEKSREELLAMRAVDFAIPGQRKHQEKLHRSLWEAGGTVETEYWINNTLKTLELTITPITYKGVGAVIGVGKDITERKQAEAELRERNKELTCLQRVRDSVDEDLSIDDLCLHILDLLAQGMQFTGFAVPVIELYDRRYTSCSPEQARGRGLQAHIEVDGENAGRVSVYYCQDEPFLPEEQSLVEAVSRILSQHLERLRARTELRDREERLQLALSGADLGAWDWAVQTGRVTLDERWAQMLGYALDELTPHVTTWEELIHPDDKPEVMERLTAHLKDETEFYEAEYRIKHKSGGWVWILDKGRVIERDAEGRPLRACGTHLDITTRKKVEEALRNNETLLAQSQQIAKVGSWQFDLTANQLSWSEETYRIFGLDPRDFAGTYEAFLEAVHPDDHDAVEGAYSNSLVEGRAGYEIEHRIVRRDTGEVRHVYEKCLHTRNARGEVVRSIGMVQDVTERVEKETEYAQFLKTAIDGFWIIDMNGRLLEVNESAAGQLGYTLEEMTRLTISDIEASESREETGLRMKILCETGYSLFETRHRRKDGTLIDVEVSASFMPVGGGRFVVFTRNITDRKEAEREDRLSKTRLEIIQRISTPGATEKAVSDTVLEGMLELTESPIGYLGLLTGEEDVMQIHAWSTSVMAECALHKGPLEFAVAQAGLWGEPIRNRRPVIVNNYGAPHPAKRGCPEGHISMTSFMSVPVFEGDRIAAVAAVGNRERPYEETDMRQLTLLMDGWWEQVRHKRAVQEKEMLQARLQQAQKMESIGTLAGGVAHDFNNILSIILGNTELAMHDLPEWSPVQVSLEETREASLRARDLVNQVLLFARRKDEAISSFDLGSVARESLKMLRASIPTLVEIHEEIQERLPAVLAGPSQLQQIIMNLCTNASQVMEAEGGVLSFKLDLAELDAPMHTSTGRLPVGAYVRIQVRDTGPGIPQENLGRIFEPFFTTKEVGEGTGLGLAVVHGIVQDRQGGIVVESEEGKGISFTVYLPASDETPAATVKAEDTEHPKGSERILFVDDEPMVMKLGQRILERHGYEVEVRSSAVDALECFRREPERFDLVVTDMTMPGMRGDRLAEEVMAIRPGIPVILCSGYSKFLSDEDLRETGIRAFVMKPLTQRDLANTVRRVLDAG